MFREYLEKIASGENLNRSEAAEALQKIIDDELSPAEIGGFLVGLRLKGESIEEISGFVDTMQKHMISVDLNDKNAIDVCGTGGDGTHSFNVSTTTALIAAAGGVSVAKHGNRSVSSKCGSADLLESLGVNINLSAENVKSCIDQTGIGFFFAPHFHPAMKKVVPHRKSLGIRTVFNMLGPLLNPAKVKRQLIGTFNAQTAEKLGGVLLKQDYLKACTVHSKDGFDELSPFAPTDVFEVGKEQGRLHHYVYDPQSLKKRTENDIIHSEDCKNNAEITLGVLSGKKNTAREMGVLNTAFAFYIAEKTKTIEEGIELAEDVIDSGQAMKKLNEFKEASNSFGQ